jgi:hypothetical protein
LTLAISGAPHLDDLALANHELEWPEGGERHLRGCKSGAKTQSQNIATGTVAGMLKVEKESSIAH